MTSFSLKDSKVGDVAIRTHKKFPGTFWGITTYFNPLGYKTKYKSYKCFREHGSRQGLKLLTVELAFGTAPFELTQQDADILIQLRTSASNVLWQKERLLNIGLERLPDDCDKVAWLDCDIVFEEGQWILQACEALSEHRVIQLFSTVIILGRGEKKGSSAGQKRHGFVYAHLNGLEHSGHAGFAWAARRQVIEKIRFYDRNILGSGDTLFKDACYGIETLYLSRACSQKVRAAQRKWARKVNSVVDQSIGGIEGTIFHLWHGDIPDRKYRSRQMVLKEYNFDPEKDVRIDESGALAWSTDKKFLHEAVADYFRLRKEDG